MFTKFHTYETKISNGGYVMISVMWASANCNSEMYLH